MRIALAQMKNEGTMRNPLVKADDREQILYAELDLAESGKTRARRPYTNLRRVELYI